ncbi:AP2 domain-containing protein [Glaciimonas sp. PCH181]|uniref:AP2 domain-containing protein n=1 Tax=Glaciimonas sp. PCH181 TaxID=2133943 RepID=UPI000D3803F3|nr:AP2 domain-containing protein [Glaciimonas sp. PCH181]PUA19626.1 hypothetical protein C7W93_07210 [Glaciimonas sp. PCH181]
MNDLICRKTMRACQQQSMCTPHQGCNESGPSQLYARTDPPSVLPIADHIGNTDAMIRQISDLSILVNRLVKALGTAVPGHPLLSQSVDYLWRKQPQDDMGKVTWTDTSPVAGNPMSDHIGDSNEMVESFGNSEQLNRLIPATHQPDVSLNAGNGDMLPIRCNSTGLEIPEGIPAHAEIYVGDGKFAICDWQDWSSIKSFNWCLTTRNRCNSLYAQAWNGAPIDERRRVTMHGLIIGGGLVDHINGDGLDNRRANLRNATHQQNSFNQRARKGGASQYKGVSIDRVSLAWRAHIRVNGKRISLGRHGVEIDAAKAYDMAARKYYGDFANCNFDLAKGA